MITYKVNEISRDLKMVAIILHGGVGSGNLNEEKLEKRKNVLNIAVEKGYHILENADSSIDAVETAIKIMEESKLFNAGPGSVTQLDGLQRMDASIMTSDLKAGAVASIKRVVHPISVARLIMEKTNHVFMNGNEAKNIVLENNLELFEDDSNNEQMDIKGTVGAVALDNRGILCAGTSTGGLSGSLSGRIGDSAVIGAGTYCNHFGGVSLTGVGEDIIRTGLGLRILDKLENSKISLELILKNAISYYEKELNEKSLVGIIILNNKGEIASAHNGKRMLIASKSK